MTDEADSEHRSEQISRTFALLTGKLEDAAALAVEGQGRGPEEKLMALSAQIAQLSGEAATIAETLAVLLTTPPGKT